MGKVVGHGERERDWQQQYNIVFHGSFPIHLLPSFFPPRLLLLSRDGRTDTKEWNSNSIVKRVKQKESFSFYSISQARVVVPHMQYFLFLRPERNRTKRRREIEQRNKYNGVFFLWWHLTKGNIPRKTIIYIWDESTVQFQNVLRLLVIVLLLLFSIRTKTLSTLRAHWNQS